MVSALASMVILAVLSLFGGHFGWGMSNYSLYDSYIYVPSDGGSSVLNSLGIIGNAWDFFGRAMTFQLSSDSVIVTFVFYILIVVIVWDLLMYIRGISSRG